MPVALSRLSVAPKKLPIAGRKVHGECAKPTRKDTAGKHCERPIKLVKTGNAGVDKFAWNGKIAVHKLAPGTYELIATPAGGASQTVALTIAG